MFLNLTLFANIAEVAGLAILLQHRQETLDTACSALCSHARFKSQIGGLNSEPETPRDAAYQLLSQTEGENLMNYPLQLSFEVLSIARKLSVIDAAGNLSFFVKQKAFKLKESVTVFADADQKIPLYELAADRIIDFSASYHFKDARGAHIGTVRRKGMKSLWRARYDIVNGSSRALTIQEANPWAKVCDSLFGEIPILGMFSGYVFHPEYLVAREDGTSLMRLKKEPAFFQGKFSIEKLGAMSEEEETRILLGLIMMVLLEKQRG